MLSPSQPSFNSGSSVNFDSSQNIINSMNKQSKNARLTSLDFKVALVVASVFALLAITATLAVSGIIAAAVMAGGVVLGTATISVLFLQIVLHKPKPLA